jgi:His/Glu/Gln/Arg/opine family amino acid ABC transporter permease subunit
MMAAGGLRGWHQEGRPAGRHGMEVDFSAVWARSDYLFQGFLLTAAVSALSIGLSFILGIGLAICRISPQPWVRWLAAAYVDIFRNTPFLIQLFFFYYGLPEIGIGTDPVVTGVIGLSLAFTATNAEIIRAGIETVGHDVVTAARSFGLSAYQRYRFIILPIALRTALRPLGSSFVNVVLTSSVLSTITVNDFLGNAIVVSSDTFRPFEVYIVVLLGYCVMTFLVAMAIKLLYQLIFARMAERPLLRT